MATDDRDVPEELTPRQRARLRARDRKRTTRMVVDAAGLKSTALALAHRRTAHPTPPPPEDG
ncbi:MAG: hypothetical protein ABI352_00480 [Candidatus Dormibacter sp.]